MKGKKFLGMPVSVILTLALTAGAVLAAFLWSQSVPSTVKIIGSEVAAYEDEACTVELTALDFGEIRGGETTTTISFYLKNEGEDPVYCALAEDELDALLALFEGEGSAVPADPDRLPLAVTIGGSYEATGTTGLIAGTDATATNIDTTTTTDAFPSSGVLLIDEELVSYTGKETNRFSGCTRGFADTTATSHTAGTTATLMQLTLPTYDLQPDETLAVGLYLTADPDIARSDKPFTLIIEAKDTAY